MSERTCRLIRRGMISIKFTWNPFDEEFQATYRRGDYKIILFGAIGTVAVMKAEPYTKFCREWKCCNNKLKVSYLQFDDGGQYIFPAAEATTQTEGGES